MSGGLHGLRDAAAAMLTATHDQRAFACVALFLAGVFVLSGVPKLRRPELAALAMVDFGVLRRPAASAGLVLGAGELALAIGLATAAGAANPVVRLVFAAGAAVLLWAFAFLIARALRSPERFSCACFGGSGEPISGRTLLRTLALACAATLLAVSAPTAVAAATFETWTLALLVATSTLGAIVLSATLRPIQEVRA